MLSRRQFPAIPLVPLFALLAVLQPLAGTAQTTRRTLPPDDLFNVQRVGAPEVRPEGDWIAYTVSTTSLDEERSFTRIWMAPAAGGEAIPLTAEKKSASSPGWSPDGRYFSFTASRDGGKTQVWVLDRRGGEAYPLTDVE